MIPFRRPSLAKIVFIFPFVNLISLVTIAGALHLESKHHDTANDQIAISDDPNPNFPQLKISDNNVHISGQYNFIGTPDEIVIFKTAYRDLYLVLKTVTNPTNFHPETFTRYFDISHKAGVNRTFQAVLDMATSGVNAIPPRTALSPLNLNAIQVSKVAGGVDDFTYLARSYNVERTDVNPRIEVYNVGWNSLWRRRTDDISCDDIGPTTDWKMHFLGTLLLHETL